jgi:phage tail protein X
MKNRIWLLAALLLSAPFGEARGFTHIVQEKDTLASLAEKYYGQIQYERLLVAANGLDAQGGSPIVKGMRLEVPALTHRVVRKGDTWDSLAQTLLGWGRRSDVLALANDTMPWLPPDEGTEIIVPYNLRIVAGPTDNLLTLAYRYFGDMNKAWVLDRYNGLGGRKLHPGDVVLIPLKDLPLTDAGKRAAAESAGNVCLEAAGATRQSQRKVAQELPALIADVRGGRYVEAVSRGNRFISSGALSEAQLATVHRQLLEAYVALEAPGQAASACRDWLAKDPGARLDPLEQSPKILAACRHAKSEKP